MNSYFYYHSASVFYYDAGDDTTRRSSTKNISIPISTSSDDDGANREEPLHFNASAVKIQAAFRGHLVRALVGRIRAVAAEADRMERLIQRQDTVDAVRSDRQERLRVAEALMALLLRLDAVPGFYPPVRELRRAVSRRIIGLQEIFDAIVAAMAIPCGGDDEDGFPATGWEKMVKGIWG